MAMALSAAAGAASFPAGLAASWSSARPRAAWVVRASSTEGGSGRWWASPLLGWSGKADYLEAPPAPARRQFVGAMTEEKAWELRARTAQTESFHDAMYHSAFASRLARSA